MKLKSTIYCCLIFVLQFHIVCAQDSIIHNKVLKLTAQQLIAPSLLTFTGLTFTGQIKHDIVDIRNNHLLNFHTNVDDMLVFSPIAFAYGLDMFGISSRNDFWNRSAILCKGELMMIGSVYLLKNTTNELRPDLSDNRSFPSSHAAQAFLAAAFLSQEYGHKIKWIPYAAYSVASSVALLRMANNRHYVGDVLVGAGIGILSQKIAYWTHQYRWGRYATKPILKF